MLVLAISSPIILIIGLLGNLVSFVIFNNEKMRNLPTFRFLAYLSLIDCLYILTGIPHVISMSFINFDFRNSSNFLCSFHSFLTIFLSHLSSNVLAAVGVLRCTELTSVKSFNRNNKRQFSLKKYSTKSIPQSEIIISYSTNENKFYENICKSVTKVEIILAFIVLILFIIDSHYLFLMRLSNEEYDFNNSIFQNISSKTDLVCYPSTMSNQKYFEFYSTVWPWIDLFLYSYVPFTVMITSTLIIIYKLFKSNRNYKNKFTEVDIELTNDLKCKNKPSFLEAERRTKRNNQVYKLLITLNVTFFILVTPLVFCNSLRLLDALDENIFQFVYLLAYSNHCFNFIFYGFTSEQFRKIFLKKIFLEF
jgi:hypothetical protein